MSAPVVSQDAVPVHLFQIAYSEQSAAAVEPGYGILDNRVDARHDWREYWPIRRYLKTQPLDEGAYYGFFSPKFSLKTGLAHGEVVAFVRGCADAHVVTFSPQPDMAALFLNVFEQNEVFDPGFVAAAEAFLAHIHRRLPLANLVMDSRTAVFSNFIVARPSFWRAWLAVNEQLYEVCEGPHTELRAALTFPTTYPGAVERKVFLMERMASLLLTVEPHWRVRAYNPFRCAWSALFSEKRWEAVVSDALKIAMREQGYPEYTDAFARLRSMLTGAQPG